ncbi:5'-AMP-activated protein kinase subunit beta-1-like isoform X2 [Tubulanus polymorphus]|uniref:5'-AMP-activated protein kinase subunit beta-1-like isoform X2 n=1 Tax=Tubulanus polymorphus TaxID=672921 RepID=UPI003DA6A58F
MGNTGTRRRNSGEDSHGQMSPVKDDGFEFSRRTDKIIYQPSGDEDFLSSSYKAGLQDSLIEPISMRKISQTQVRPSVLPTVFKWEGGGKEAYLCGSFSNWKTKIPMVKSKSNFYTIVDLPEGEHQYKFCVDGEWVHDPNEKTKNNDVGTQNNIIEVKQSDFEVFEALAADSIASKGISDKTSLSGSPPGDYSQEVPTRKPEQRGGGPPLLPPHLLQVILNKDIPISCEPTLLPEPNHVMLNHLYALSIKDGVMVLSATHRYRKKYVTTLLYKPI